MAAFTIPGSFYKMKKTATRAFSVATAGLLGIIVAVAMPVSAHAADSQVVVTPPVNSQGWSTHDTNGGSVTFTNDLTAPGHPDSGALGLTTSSATDVAQYFHAADTALSNVSELSYYTKQNAPAGPVADPAYQLVTFLNGGTSGFTTLVFEPYQNPVQGPIANGEWQQWDVGQGLFWSTRTVTCSNGTIAGVPGGPASYTLAEINEVCPEAHVAAFGVNVGSNNPNYDVEADLVDFNGTTYNFEPYITATNKDQCKKDGWTKVRDGNGSTFRNQGDCVSFVATGKNEPIQF